MDPAFFHDCSLVSDGVPGSMDVAPVTVALRPLPSLKSELATSLCRLEAAKAIRDKALQAWFDSADCDADAFWSAYLLACHRVHSLM